MMEKIDEADRAERSGFHRNAEPGVSMMSVVRVVVSHRACLPMLFTKVPAVIAPKNNDGVLHVRSNPAPA